ncbi:hypothetical protein J6590_101986 [Homalodisca vitripennis]|nr:hypothetical protein J6590_101986 [Homalodisca vitripennis]
MCYPDKFIKFTYPFFDCTTFPSSTSLSKPDLSLSTGSSTFNTASTPSTSFQQPNLNIIHLKLTPRYGVFTVSHRFQQATSDNINWKHTTRHSAFSARQNPIRSHFTGYTPFLLRCLPSRAIWYLRTS